MFETESRERPSGFGPGTNSGIDNQRDKATGEPVDGWAPAPTGVRGVLPDGLGSMLPGAALGSVLATIDRSVLNGYELVLLIQAERRQMMFYEASSMQSIVELAHCPPGFAGSPAERSLSIDVDTADELRPALGWTRRAAETVFALAVDLTERFPLVLREMREGKIDGPKARVIVSTLETLEDHQIQKITEEKLTDAAEKTTGELGARLRRAAISVDPDAAAKTYEQGLKERSIELYPNSDGTAVITADRLPALLANRAMRYVNEVALAVKTKNDPRTIDQIRADVFLDLLNGRTITQPNNNRQGLDSAPRRRGTVDIRIDLATLAHLNDNPGELPGWGPVTAEIARQAANPDDIWQATIVDENGQVVSVGTIRRRPNNRQHRQITTELPTCLFPGCRMPSHLSDIDHNHPYSEGGKTEHVNLGPGCRHDHNLKTSGKWKLRRNPNRTYTWTSPHGHKYTTGGPEPP